ncbi:hypothetical protein SKAU_G00105080 [Synaphobranchus kaupii]|uniref:Uncharacterized protein n=1 Tax=Synaphobranchus kaupii TaxID=118154 RepID=A0A9Q1G066_SYNKA|nr:hypothetical protein SKAU_G00105080 [Synaphobranchus kaupii]
MIGRQGVRRTHGRSSGGPVAHRRRRSQRGGPPLGPADGTQSTGCLMCRRSIWVPTELKCFWEGVIPLPAPGCPATGPVGRPPALSLFPRIRLSEQALPALVLFQTPGPIDTPHKFPPDLRNGLSLVIKRVLESCLTPTLPRRTSDPVPIFIPMKPHSDPLT